MPSLSTTEVRAHVLPLTLSQTRNPAPRCAGHPEPAATADATDAFVPPPEDVAYVDARALGVRDAHDDEVVAAERRDDVSAFSRPVRNAERLARAHFCA
jgi:hypothetical protein